VQIYSMNEILGRKNNAVMALVKLQSQGSRGTNVIPEQTAREE
jgi:hypothetical protein